MTPFNARDPFSERDGGVLRRIDGYVTLHASSRRDGRVNAPARPWSQWERLVLLDDRAPPLRGSPRGVLVDPSGTRTLAIYDGSVVVVEPYGSRTFSGPQGGSWIAVADPEGLLFGDRWHPWEGSEPRLIGTEGLFADGLYQWAVERGPRGYGTVGRVAATRQLVAQLPGGQVVLPAEAGPLSTGPAVIADGVAVIALPDGTLVRTDGVETTTLTDGLTVCELSLCGDAIVTVSADRRHVRVHDRDGALRWSCALPFPVHQPPLDGGDGRIYAAGDGVAAIADGEVTWHFPADRRLFATSLGLEGVVVAGGRRLDHLDRNGLPATTLEIPDGSRCCAPPAINSTGEIHLGTTTGIFVLR